MERDQRSITLRLLVLLVHAAESAKRQPLHPTNQSKNKVQQVPDRQW